MSKLKETEVKYEGTDCKSFQVALDCRTFAGGEYLFVSSALKAEPLRWNVMGCIKATEQRHWVVLAEIMRWLIRSRES